MIPCINHMTCLPKGILEFWKCFFIDAKWLSYLLEACPRNYVIEELWNFLEEISCAADPKVIALEIFNGFCNEPQTNSHSAMFLLVWSMKTSLSNGLGVNNSKYVGE